MSRFGRRAGAAEPLAELQEPAGRSRASRSLGRYSFQLPDRPGGLRPLRDKNAAADEE
ncbi:hypothetical protein ABZO31_33895 [Streptomyces sp. HUAS MG47]|uniref:hypothetical protein n=1 Tax=Streptomyces solicamelliae TaxID=3231716 RepID=UPI003877E7F1